MAQNLTDKAGRGWALDLTIGTAIRIQDQTGFNLLADTSFLADKPGGMAAALPQLEADPIALTRVLAAACEEEFTARNLTREQFLASWDGPSLKTGYKTLCEAICDFFPDRAASIRRMLAAIESGREKTTAAQGAMTDAAAELLSRINVEEIIAQAMRQADAELSKTLGSGSGKMPGTSASPDRNSTSSTTGSSTGSSTDAAGSSGQSPPA
jgi:hypothetical protein